MKNNSGRLNKRLSKINVLARLRSLDTSYFTKSYYYISMFIEKDMGTFKLRRTRWVKSIK